MSKLNLWMILWLFLIICAESRHLGKKPLKPRNIGELDPGNIREPKALVYSGKYEVRNNRKPKGAEDLVFHNLLQKHLPPPELSLNLKKIYDTIFDLTSITTKAGVNEFRLRQRTYGNDVHYLSDMNDILNNIDALLVTFCDESLYQDPHEILEAIKYWLLCKIFQAAPVILCLMQENKIDRNLNGDDSKIADWEALGDFLSAKYQTLSENLHGNLTDPPPTEYQRIWLPMDLADQPLIPNVLNPKQTKNIALVIRSLLFFDCEEICSITINPEMLHELDKIQQELPRILVAVEKLFEFFSTRFDHYSDEESVNYYIFIKRLIVEWAQYILKGLENSQLLDKPIVWNIRFGKSWKMALYNDFDGYRIWELLSGFEFVKGIHEIKYTHFSYATDVWNMIRIVDGMDVDNTAASLEALKIYAMASNIPPIKRLGYYKVLERNIYILLKEKDPKSFDYLLRIYFAKIIMLGINILKNAQIPFKDPMINKRISNSKYLEVNGEIDIKNVYDLFESFLKPKPVGKNLHWIWEETITARGKRFLTKVTIPKDVGFVFVGF